MTSQTPSLIERLEPVTTGDAGRTAMDSATLFCTECGCDTGVEFGVMDDKPVHVVATLCREWRCNECLDRDDAALSAAKGSAQP